MVTTINVNQKSALATALIERSQRKNFLSFLAFIQLYRVHRRTAHYIIWSSLSMWIVNSLIFARMLPTNINNGKWYYMALIGNWVAKRKRNNNSVQHLPRLKVANKKKKNKTKSKNQSIFWNWFFFFFVKHMMVHDIEFVFNFSPDILMLQLFDWL